MNTVDDMRLEEYRQLKQECRTKGDRILQVALGGLAAIGAIFAISMREDINPKMAPFMALLPGCIAVIIMVWTKQLEFTGHRIAAYLRGIENETWGESENEVLGFERWLRETWNQDHHIRFSDRIHLVCSLVPLFSAGAFLLLGEKLQLHWGWDILILVLYVVITYVACRYYSCSLGKLIREAKKWTPPADKS